MPHQPDYELRPVAVLDGGSEVVADFSQRESTEQAFFLGVETGKIRQIRLQRRPYDWVEFKGVPRNGARRRFARPLLRRVPATLRRNLPGLRPQLGDGITAELVGVGEDDHWWRPDGSPLAERRADSRALQSQPISQMVRRFFLQLKGCPSARGRHR